MTGVGPPSLGCFGVPGRGEGEADHPVGPAAAMGASTAVLALAGGADVGGAALGVVTLAGFGLDASLISKRSRRRRGIGQDG